MTNFPENFIWGAASSAYQIEGYPTADGGGESVWDTFCAVSGNVFGNEDGSAAADAYHRYREDIALMAELGIPAYRFSLSWARIDPNGTGEWNAEGLAYYDAVVDACLEKGITPYLTLHHWELPQAIQNRGGWLIRETAESFAQYAGMAAAHFSGRVRNYFTLNEPQCIVKLGNHTAEHAPGLKLPMEQCFVIWKHLLLAHGLGAKAIRAADPDALVGFASTGKLCYPVSETSEDIAAAERATRRINDEDWMFTHTMACDPIILGTLSPEKGSRLEHFWNTFTEKEIEEIHQVPDFLGINCYNGSAIRADGPECETYVERFPGFPRTALKWPITPEVMYWGMKWIWQRYQTPIFISENGLSCNDKVFLDGKVHDPDRIDFLTRYLNELQKASKETGLRGYFHWSLTDNFEWNKGYSERFGLIYIDYPTQRRIPKDSAYWYSDVIRNNGTEG